MSRVCRGCLLMDSGEGGGAEGRAPVVRAEVGAGWWDDSDGARFKAFTGQLRDWPQPKLLFWKDLLFRVAHRLCLCSAPAHLVTTVWFARSGGLTPLCLPQVLEEMRADGKILLKSGLIDPTAGSLYQLVRRERAADIFRQLSDSHWASTCVVWEGTVSSGQEARPC